MELTYIQCSVLFDPNEIVEDNTMVAILVK